MPTTNKPTSRNKPSSSRGRSAGGRARTTAKKKKSTKKKTKSLLTASGKPARWGNMHGSGVRKAATG